MKKLSVILALVLVLCMSLIPVTSLAASGNCLTLNSKNDALSSLMSAREKIGLAIVKSTNIAIQSAINVAVRKGNNASTPAQLDRIIRNLQITTNAISYAGQKSAAFWGVKTVCDYVLVQIGNRVVMIDPLRVVLV